MAPEENPKKPPLPLLFGRMAEWSGWEYLYEERRKVTAIVIVIVCLLLGLGWFASKRETSSLGKLLRAEAVVDAITDPSNEEPPATIQADVSTLFSLSQNEEVVSTFSGVLAQEEIVAKKRDLEATFFDITSKKALEQGCPTIASVTQLSLLQGKGLREEALTKIEELLSQPNSPWMSLYLLIQKAHILQELGRPNFSTIEELRAVSKNIESVDDFFNTWLHLNANDFFESLVKN
jgi:hypothetical protein